jgi:hypothetical protein
VFAAAVLADVVDEPPDAVLRPPLTAAIVVVIEASAARPASTGHRKSAVATTSMKIAQPTAAVLVAISARRARQISSAPVATRTIGTQLTKSTRYNVSLTSRTSGSNSRRNVGRNATSTTAFVKATAALGMRNSQLATAVPAVASGARAASGPQPRSYVVQRRPA